MRRRALAAVLLTAALLTGCAASGAKKAPETQTQAAELTVHCYDAGKADAILLTTANSAVLIDAGEKGFGKTILADLSEKGIDRLDYLIVTHFDKDHVGGAAKIINTIPVGTVLQSNRPKDSEEYEKYTNALANAGIEPVTVRDTLIFTLDGVTYAVDPPRQTEYKTDASNNSSLILSVVNGGDRFLFTGDAQTERLAEYLVGHRETCDVLKLPHHGQEEPLLEELLETVKPAYAVITSSEEEPESAAVTELLERLDVEALLTRKGAVTLRSSGNGIVLDVSRTV